MDNNSMGASRNAGATYGCNTGLMYGGDTRVPYGDYIGSDMVLCCNMLYWY